MPQINLTLVLYFVFFDQVFPGNAMDLEDKEEKDLQCGWRSWKPKFMQQFNSPKWFLFFFTVFSCVQGKGR